MRVLFQMLNVPVTVGYAQVPVETRNEFISTSPSQAYTRCSLRLTSIQRTPLPTGGFCGLAGVFSSVGPGVGTGVSMTISMDREPAGVSVASGMAVASVSGMVVAGS